MQVEPVLTDELLELTSKGPIPVSSFPKSLTIGRALTTLAVMSRVRKSAIIAYNAFLANEAVSVVGEVTGGSACSSMRN